MRTGLTRLEHERYARMEMRGELPEVEIEPVRVPPAPAALKRGGRSQHPGWYQVLAMVKKPTGTDLEFVTEAKTVGEAITCASRYPFRAVVVSPHSRKEFDNNKTVEEDGAVL
jgi:hypothetical protein